MQNSTHINNFLGCKYCGIGLHCPSKTPSGRGLKNQPLIRDEILRRHNLYREEVRLGKTNLPKTACIPDLRFVFIRLNATTTNKSQFKYIKMIKNVNIGSKKINSQAPYFSILSRTTKCKNNLILTSESDHSFSHICINLN